VRGAEASTGWKERWARQFFIDASKCVAIGARIIFAIMILRHKFT
jgi:hypothetical protein